MADDGDNIADSWEEIDENQLLNGITAQEAVKPVFFPSGPMVIQGDDALRSQYLPPEPLVKILKRPSKQERDSLMALKANGATLAKSLKQREVEYAEARLRIMGNHTDDSLCERMDRLESASTSSTGPTSTSPNVTYTLLRPTERLEPNLVRMPRGPDGTAGFTLKR